MAYPGAQRETIFHTIAGCQLSSLTGPDDTFSGGFINKIAIKHKYYANFHDLILSEKCGQPQLSYSEE